MINYAKQVDKLIAREKALNDDRECPRCHGPRTDETRRFCAPCILSFQSKKLKNRKAA